MEEVAATAQPALWLERLAPLMELVSAEHHCVEEAEASAIYEAPFHALPLSSALQLTPRQLKHQVTIRAEKDRRLKSIVCELARNGPLHHIDNPCTVFGRHARQLARTLPSVSVSATDIDPTWERLFGLYESVIQRRPPSNYAFGVESVYAEPRGKPADLLVVFGACGSLADAAILRAVRRRAPYLVLRACCHENICLNTKLSTRRLTLWHVGHRLKNVVFKAQHATKGFYFDDAFAAGTYPLSSQLRSVLQSTDMLRIARHSVDCAACRLLIDVDRLCFLQEQGYTLDGYHQGMTVARLDTSTARNAA